VGRAGEQTDWYSEVGVTDNICPDTAAGPCLVNVNVAPFCHPAPCPPAPRRAAPRR
jgi:hypothetical protein